MFVLHWLARWAMWYVHRNAVLNCMVFNTLPFVSLSVLQVYKVSVPALASTQQSEVVLGLNSSSTKNGKTNGVQGVPLPTTKPVCIVSASNACVLTCKNQCI